MLYLCWFRNERDLFFTNYEDFLRYKELWMESDEYSKHHVPRCTAYRLGKPGYVLRNTLEDYSDAAILPNIGLFEGVPGMPGTHETHETPEAYPRALYRLEAGEDSDLRYKLDGYTASGDELITGYFFTEIESFVEASKYTGRRPEMEVLVKQNTAPLWWDESTTLELDGFCYM